MEDSISSFLRDSYPFEIPNILKDVHEIPGRLIKPNERKTKSSQSDSGISSPEINSIPTTPLFKTQISEIDINQVDGIIYKDYNIDDYCVVQNYKVNLNIIEDWVDVEIQYGIYLRLSYIMKKHAVCCSAYSFELDNKRKKISISLMNNKYSRSYNMGFNEVKVFKPVTESDLSGMTLNVKVYDWNRVMKDQLIGEVNCSLGILLENDVEEDNKRMVTIHKNLVIATNSDQYLGSILLSLCLDIKAQQMKITIIKGKDLKAMDANASSDPFCTLKLFCDGSKIGSRKTSVKYKTLNPVWNESFPFTVTQKSFTKNLRLNIRVYDRDVTGKEFIGEIDFPSSNGSIEYKHWDNMIDNQNVTIAEWHSLKPKSK